MLLLTEWMAAEFDSLAWYDYEYSNELDMNMKNHQLLKDRNVQLKTIRQARMMADRLVD